MGKFAGGSPQVLISWHISGICLIPLDPLSFSGILDVGPTESLTFSPGDLRFSYVICLCSSGPMRSLNSDWKPGMPEKDKFIVTGCSAKKTKNRTENVLPDWGEGCD